MSRLDNLNDPLWRVRVEYTDGGVQSEAFVTKEGAEGWAREECAWEGTDHAIVKGPDYECFFAGDFS
jgi:hypothetical protein